jgi:inner membrane protein
MNNNNTNNSPENKTMFSKIKSSSSIKLIIIAALCLIMLIPLKLVQGLITERQDRKNQVTQKISHKWGKEVRLSTPILKVPYCYNESYSTKGTYTYSKNCTKYIYLFPESCQIKSNADVQTKKYGIYKSSVFESKHLLIGKFLNSAYWDKELKGKELLWSKAKLVMDISSLKGVKSDLRVEMNGENYKFKNSDINENSNYHSIHHNLLETKEIDLSNHASDHEITLNLEMNGSEGIYFTPLAQETKVNLGSNWQTPSYSGSFLPSISEDKSQAEWKVMSFNSSVPAYILNDLPVFSNQSFGVKFIQPVNDYLKNERTAKYGLLVISLTFLTFFLIQMTSGMSVHPFQYLLIGLALALFYVILLSFSEHLGFNAGYVIAGSMTIVLITLFSKSLFLNWKLPGFVLITLSVLYSFLFIIMHLETYSLLVGSIGLFIILSIVMFFSRKINWNN